MTEPLYTFDGQLNCRVAERKARKIKDNSKVQGIPTNVGLPNNIILLLLVSSS